MTTPDESARPSESDVSSPEESTTAVVTLSSVIDNQSEIFSTTVVSTTPAERVTRFRGVFDLEQFRVFFREERERLRWGRDKLAERAGVSGTTIQNLETSTDVPSIETVAKLVEAMPDHADPYALSKFFAAYEKKRADESGFPLHAPTESVTTPPTDETAGVETANQGGLHGQFGGGALIYDDAEEAEILAFANLLIRAGTRLRYAAGTLRADGQPADQVQPDAGRKSDRGTGRPRRGK